MFIDHIKTLSIFILAGAIAYLFFKNLDFKYKYTEKARVHFKINKKWEGLIYYLILFIPLLSISIIGIYFTDISSNIYAILWGIALGINTHMQQKNNAK
ncbi:hypothetical protein ACJDT4_17495 [Clostridium neuense]|uniref:DUF3784 domain-containing protein n=1 Tax=Clostridium neuense TaxID=1728934 RepID=A0ABW8TJI4_9CLOT